MAIVNPEMKPYVWLETNDGSIQQVEEEVAMFCPMICQEVLQTGMGTSKNYAIKLPQRFNPAMLGMILDYCRFHQCPGCSNKERKTFDEKFIRLDTKNLCGLTSVADSLQLRPLADLTSRALARMIEGKSPEEIRETFHLPNDLTEEEKLEPLRNMTYDPHVRLLNRLYARKRKELKEREDEDSKCIRTAKNKKKNLRRKDQPRSSCSNNENGNHGKKSDVEDVSCLSKTSKLQESSSGTFSPMLDFDDLDIDDELDPAMKEELDRELEDFGRRLNSVWPERMQEILSLGQERQRVPISMKNLAHTVCATCVISTSVDRS